MDISLDYREIDYCYSEIVATAFKSNMKKISSANVELFLMLEIGVIR